MKRKKNYAMMKLATPKRVTLPNGRTFFARYKRIPRDHLPPHVNMSRTYTRRAAPRGWRQRRGGQQGQGIFDFIKKVAKDPIVKSIAKQGLKYAPAVYSNLTGSVKNKTWKRILNLDIAHSTLNKTIRAANRRLQWVRD